MGSCWDHFEIIFRSCWDRFGFVLVLIWDHFQFILVLVWDRFGIVLGSFGGVGNGPGGLGGYREAIKI